MSQFAFLQHEWAGIFDSAFRAEEAVHADPAPLASIKPAC